MAAARHHSRRRPGRPAGQPVRHRRSRRGLLCFEASTSKRLWTVAADTNRILAADASAVYLVTRDGRLRAVDTATRKVRWTVALEQNSLRAPGSKAAPGARAAAGPDRLVVCGADGTVFAVDTSTGGTIWKVVSQARSAVQPLVVGDAVYLGGRTLNGLNIRTGTELWDPTDAKEPPKEDSGGWGPPVQYGESLWAMDGTAMSQARLSTGLPTAWGSAVHGPLPHVPPWCRPVRSSPWRARARASRPTPPSAASGCGPGRPSRAGSGPWPAPGTACSPSTAGS